MKKYVLSFICSILILLISVALSLGIMCETNFLYYIDVDRLGIPEQSGMNREDAIKNINAVMDYLSPFSNEEFSLPNLEYSSFGASHFSDCKVIFNAIFMSGGISIVLLCIIIAAYRKNLSFLICAGILSAILPIVVSIICLVGFSSAFQIFHSLLFNSGSWLFDPVTDPVILLLPERYFMDCAIFIAVFCVFIGITVSAISFIFKKVRKSR